MPVIEENPYDSDVHYQGKRRPLLIGCSGGGGHNSAINGIADHLKISYDGSNLDFVQHTPAIYNETLNTKEQKEIALGVKAMHGLGPASMALRTILDKTRFPILPNEQDLQAEIASLAPKINDKGVVKTRQYIDMLLDVYPAGFESAAIWNVLQKADKTETLKKLILLQIKSDNKNYEVVKNAFFEKLKKAVKENIPYTELISTQAMALPALCDAVIAYNQWLDSIDCAVIPKPPKIVIHQYMTDLPTVGAVHFFNALKTLTTEQQKVMKLYGVNLKDKVLNDTLQNRENFAGLFKINPKDNPMVRLGFKDPTLDMSSKVNEGITATIKDYDLKTNVPFTDKVITIAAGSKVASIMLGSQASNDTVEYVEILLEQQYDKIFVFGGLAEHIKPKLQAIIDNASVEQKASLQSRIIMLGNQSDKEMTPIMTRSQCVVVRSGGVSVMENMAMPHAKEKIILIHHANQHNTKLTSGISWEDDNGSELINDLKGKGVTVIKTTPERTVQAFQKQALKKHIEEHDALGDKFLTELSDEKQLALGHCVHDEVLFNYLKEKLDSEDISQADITAICRFVSRLHPQSLRTKKNIGQVINNANLLKVCNALLDIGSLENEKVLAYLNNNEDFVKKINQYTADVFYKKLFYAQVFCQVDETQVIALSHIKDIANLMHDIFRNKKSLIKNKILKEAELQKIKKALFAVLLITFGVRKFFFAINETSEYLESQKPHSAIMKLKKEWKEYQFTHLQDVFELQNASLEAKEILKNLQHLIFYNKWYLGFFEWHLGFWGGTKIKLQGSNQRKSMTKVPCIMSQIFNTISTALEKENVDYQKVLQKIKDTVQQKVNTGNARKEYHKLNDALDSILSKPQEVPVVAVR